MLTSVIPDMYDFTLHHILYNSIIVIRCVRGYFFKCLPNIFRLKVKTKSCEIPLDLFPLLHTHSHSLGVSLSLSLYFLASFCTFNTLLLSKCLLQFAVESKFFIAIMLAWNGSPLFLVNTHFYLHSILFQPASSISSIQFFLCHFFLPVR